MPASTVVKSKFDKGSVILSDGTTPTPLSHTIQYDNGDWEITGLVPQGRALVIPETRGHRSGPARLGARQYPAFKITGKLAALTDTGAGTLYDFIFAKAGTPYAARRTTESYGATAVQAETAQTFTVTVNLEGSDYGDAGDHTFVCNKVAITVDASMGDEGVLTISGQVLGTVTQDGVVVVSE